MPEPLSGRQSLPAPDDTAPDLPAVPGQPGARTGTDEREHLGRLVHEVRLACEAARAEAEGRPRFLLGEWPDRGEHQRELDMAIGAAVAAAERERIAARMDELAAYYPESVWPPDSDVRDSIGATAMRHAYRNAAREIREMP